ncbi:unnamed protein product [Ectocarpus sp. 13 AM-2016]
MCSSLGSLKAGARTSYWIASVPVLISLYVLLFLIDIYGRKETTRLFSIWLERPCEPNVLTVNRFQEQTYPEASSCYVCRLRTCSSIQLNGLLVAGATNIVLDRIRVTP